MKSFLFKLIKKSLFNITLLFTLILSTVSSCRKDTLTPDTSIKITEQVKIQPGDISKWLRQQQSFPAFTIQWSKAQQAVIENAHVVRIPISGNECMVFIKDSTNALNVFTVKWEAETLDQAGFTGKSSLLSYQDGQIWVQQYVNGKPFRSSALENGDRSLLKSNTLSSDQTSILGDKLTMIMVKNILNAGQIQTWFIVTSYLAGDHGHTKTWDDYYYSEGGSGETPTQLQILANTIGTTAEWLEQNPTEADFFMEALAHDDSPESFTAARIMVYEKQNSWQNGPYNLDYFNSVVAPNITGSEYDIGLLSTYWGIYFSAKCAMVKSQHPEWADGSYISKFNIRFEATKEMLHLMLDLGGLIPVIGEVCDITNGAIYTIQGDGVNASLSYASAIPILGWWTTGYKYASKMYILSNGSKTYLNFLKKTNGFISFGTRGQLRKILNLAVGNSLQAHHIIPWEFIEDPIVQAAAKLDFHMNDALNGIALPKSLHVESMTHYNYNARVANSLEAIRLDIGTNPSPSAAKAALENLAWHIRTAIVNNPGVSLDNLIF